MIWTVERIQQAEATCAKWHGTPHRDRVAIVGAGIDCVMFVNEILADAGIIERVEFPAYPIADGIHEPSHRLAKAIENFLHVESATLDAAQFGDIGVGVTGQGRSAHILFVGNGRVWHSLAGVGVTHGKYNVWKSHISRLYRINGEGVNSLKFT